ncbi:sperm-associated antigen 1 [Drosophila guanche]|uniref:Blast:Sperm-associated antigen 1 n=2 Tax=Drosophila guanche TaxID=7266 RepID=A0A3B0JFK1_DROGU|nr:sperm-associated antigen 1 [Drosophila guanche]SPP81117.1 blast:Sperm-associated antigen 1 [Drosophila guanche]
MEKRKTLLEKYNIPLSHLDFSYVKTCKNAREMEKIVQILRSGEEGNFPDLQRCSEEKLKELKPDSKLFRFEEPIQKSNILDKQELKPVLDWTHDIKSKDNALNELKNDMACLGLDVAPMRKPAKIDADMPSTKKQSKPKPPAPPMPPKTTEKRIRSTDYNKWDKYDPDEEILRMELSEERTKEQEELKNRHDPKPTPTSEEILKSEKEALYERLQQHLKKLSQVEKEQFAERHRLRGNEYFKSKEYESAIEEYNCAIIYDPENAARAYNNRALSHMKVKNYLAAISDCKACLEMEPENLKARLRLADASYAQGFRRESLHLYQRVLELQPDNAAALKALELLKKQLGELAPTHATRLMIEELKPDASDKPKEKPKEVTTPVAKTVPVAKPPPVKEYDLAELVKPNRVVKSKLVTAAESLGNKFKPPPASAPKKQTQPQALTGEASTLPAMLRMPQDNIKSSNKLLIQEI